MDGDCSVGRDVRAIAGVDFDQSKARPLERVAIAERERTAGAARDAFEMLDDLEFKLGLN